MNENKPNIIILVLDTARAKSFSCYGYGKKTTPYIDRFADSATFYENCFSPAPWTLPSHASLFTGLYTGEHNVNGANLFFDDYPTFMTRHLSEIGYKTYGLTANDLLSSYFGFSGYFDNYQCLWEGFSSARSDYFNRCLYENKNKKDKLLALVRKFFESPLRGSVCLPPFLLNKFYFKNTIRKDSTPSTQTAVKLFKKILQNKKDSPVFIFINFMQTHRDYNPPEEFRKKFTSKNLPVSQSMADYYTGIAKLSNDDFVYLSDLYDAELNYVDYEVSNIIQFLKDSKLYDDCLLIVTSDHGEQIGEHNHLYHNFSIYNELLRVPLIIKFPFQRKGNSVTRIVQTHDLHGTILEILRLGHNNSSSISLLGSEPRKYAFSALFSNKYFVDVIMKNCKPEAGPEEEVLMKLKKLDFPRYVIISDGLMKLIKNVGHEDELYDLNRDPIEADNLIHDLDYSTIYKDLNKKLDGIIEEKINTNNLAGNDDKDFEEEIYNKLKVLGYV